VFPLTVPDPLLSKRTPALVFVEIVFDVRTLPSLLEKKPMPGPALFKITLPLTVVGASMLTA